MFPSLMVFVILLSAVLDVLVYLQDRIAKRKAAYTSSAIAISKSVWARSSNFRRKIISNYFYFFKSGSSFAYPLKVCSKRNGNDSYGYLLGSYLKSALKAWDRYTTVSLTVSVTSLSFVTGRILLVWRLVRRQPRWVLFAKVWIRPERRHF